MKDLWQYPVRYVYGYSKAYFDNKVYHLGEDRPAPTGTPVPVNGHVIGTVGSTGKSDGSHCHIGRWPGGTYHVNPNGGGQTLDDDAAVTQIDTKGNTNNGKFVRIRSGGVDWLYLHLDSVSVAVGDKLIKGEDKPMDIWQKLDETNRRLDAIAKSIDQLYKVVDEDQKNLARLYETADNLNREVAKLKGE